MPATKHDLSDRQAAMARARQALTKKFGAESIVDMQTGPKPVAVIPTGALLVDRALGIGGWPRGRIVELFGEEASGKSSIAIATTRECQRLGDPVLYLDYEHSFDLAYARRFGVSDAADLLVLSQPDSFEQGISIVEFMLEAGAVGLIVVDSLAAMATQVELDGEVGDRQVAVKARAMSQELRRLTPLLDRAGAVMIFINHTTDVIGGFNPTGQPRHTTPGGKALKFYASVRAELRVTRRVTSKIVDETGKAASGFVGTRNECKVVKNKLAPPYQVGSFYLRNGLCDAWTVLEVAVQQGVVQKAGAFLTLPFDGARLQGELAAVDYLQADPERVTRLRGMLVFDATPQPANPTSDDLALDGSESI